MVTPAASGSMHPNRRTKSESDAKLPAAERGRTDSQGISSEEQPPNSRTPPEVRRSFSSVAFYAGLEELGDEANSVNIRHVMKCSRTRTICEVA